jgi:CHAT domain-containing protein/Tfp pilus assembly protein PilF
MKARWKLRLGSFMGTGIFLLACVAHTQAQQPTSPSNTPSSPAQAQSDQSQAVAAQIDELIKQCNEQMNVKGQFKEAEESAQRAFDLSQKLGDNTRTLKAMLYLSSALFYVGRTSEALEMTQKTVAFAREIGNKKGLSRALNNMAGMLGEMGRFEESLNYLHQSMDVARELSDEPMQYTVLINIGQLYLRLGDPDKAEAPLMESLRTGRGLKHSDLVSNPSKVASEGSLQLLGEMEAAREHYQLALNYLQQVRDSHPDSTQTVIGILDSMAVIHQRLGESQKALELLQEAKGLAETTASLSYWGVVADLGESQESLGQLNEALASETLAMAAVRKGGGNPDYEWQIERRIGHIDHSLGRDEEGLAHYQSSIHGIERLRATALNTEPGRASFAGRSRAVYAETADLLYDLHRESEALEIAERGRARAFLDMLAVSRSGLPNELTPGQHSREDAILARITAAQKDLWKEGITPEEEKKHQVELSAAEDNLEAFHLEVRQNNPRYASIQYPEPVSVSQIQNRLLDEHTALVEFLLGEKRSLVWVVTKSKITTAVLPAYKDIEEQVAAYRRVLTERTSALTLHQSLSQVSRLGANLYGSLFRPIEAAAGTSQILIIVPDGALDYLPFEALVAGSSSGMAGMGEPAYLVEKFSFVYGPSASALLMVQTMNREVSAPAKMLLAFGDPVMSSSSSSNSSKSRSEVSRSAPEPPETLVTEDYTERGFSLVRLPYTRDEVLAISKLFPVSQRRVYLGDEASEEAVKTEKLTEFRYIHFASHGFIDEAKPGRSGILLSRSRQSAEDGVLQMGEIMRLRMNADLVTLSACSTGLGKLVSGEGILGLTRAFLYSGARNVTVSLWDVNDSATAALMKVYYRNLNQNAAKSGALRQAKLRLLGGKNPAWRHPYYWAAFVLVGEGK